MKFLGALTLSALFAVSFTSQAESSQPDVTACPGDFYSINMPGDAVQCQRFDDDMPASLVFHTPMENQQIIDWYKEAMPELDVVSQFNGRVVLAAQQNNIRVVISPDNDGSQIDLLVIDTLLARQ